MARKTLAVDFGTSNTAASVIEAGRPRALNLEGAEQTLPSAVFLDLGRRELLFGHAAVASLIDGRDGRFMRALKSVLGTPLMRERRQIFQERLTLVALLGRFLGAVKTRAEAETGTVFDAVLSGRPVRFHPDPARDARAEADLHAAYQAAGFDQIRFLTEPEAAARAAGPGDGLGLIVDIGGGTSDFSVFEGAGADTRILGRHGVRIGGTDFDKALSLAHVMPLFGKDSLVRAELGPKTHPAPAAIFNDLASWEKIAFLYGPETTRTVANMVKLAEAPDRLGRLMDVLDLHLGHDVAFAVEDAKIAANQRDATQIDLSVVEKGLLAALDPRALEGALGPFAQNIAAAAIETVERAGCAPGDISRIVYVGGSSLMQAVSSAVGRALPKAEPEFGHAFTAISDGLAIAAAADD